MDAELAEKIRTLFNFVKNIILAFLLSFPVIWNSVHFQRVCYLTLCYDFFLHFAYKTWTYA